MADTFEPSDDNERRRRLTILADGPIPDVQENSEETPGLRRRLSWVGGHQPGRIPENDGLDGDTFQTQSMKMRVGAVSRPGNDPMKRRKENQDCYCVHDRFNNRDDQIFLSVFDGHGPNGGYASHFVRDRLPEEYLAIGEDMQANPAEVMRIASLKTALRLTESDINVHVSGTTGITCLIQGNKVWVANVGDSRAVLGRRDPQTGKLVAVELSSDHKPDRPDEQARIENSGGRVFEWGVPRVWLRDVGMPGLAMSRSFGDLAAETVGVYAEPEIRSEVLTDQDLCLVLASDGIWEFMSSQDVIDYLSPLLQGDPQEACRKLVLEAIDRWRKEEEVIDDTTAIVVFFDRSGKGDKATEGSS